MRQLRDRSQREIDRLDEVMDTFRRLEVKQLISDEMLYRELRDRFGDYFTGGMGAESLQTLIGNFDLESEAELLREIVRA
jgi:DNA-directed RNA polymerase subunit beta'